MRSLAHSTNHLAHIQRTFTRMNLLPDYLFIFRLFIFGKAINPFGMFIFADKLRQYGKCLLAITQDRHIHLYILIYFR